MKAKPTQQRKGERFFPKIEATCLCGQRFLIGHNGEGFPTIVHDLPPCRAFIDNDLPDFLHLVRLHLTAKAQA